MGKWYVYNKDRQVGTRHDEIREKDERKRPMKGPIFARVERLEEMAL
jgi:hypothetical protein